MFTEKDLEQIAAHGLSVEAVNLQIENFRRGFPSLKVVSAASPGDGITILTPEQAAAYAESYENRDASVTVAKFVPASGAATRMFKELFEFVNEDINYRFLQGCTKVSLVLPYEIRIVFQIVSQEIQERSLQT